MSISVGKQPYERIRISFDFGSKYGVDNPARFSSLRSALLDVVTSAGSLAEAQSIAAAALAVDNDALGAVITAIQEIAVDPTGHADDIEVVEQAFSGLVAQVVVAKGRTVVEVYKISCRVAVSNGELLELDGYAIMKD